MKFHHIAAACVMSAALLAGVAPAGAKLVGNALVSNGLSAAGSAIGDLNGVTVEAVRRDRIDGVEPAPGDKTGEIALYQLSQIDPGEKE